MKRKIASTPGLGSPVPVPLDKMYRISEAPGKGVGMLADRDINAGELVVAERPLVIVPAKIHTHRPSMIPAHLTMEQVMQVLLCDTESMYSPVFDRLTPAAREAFYKLADSHLHDGSGPIMGRIRTNAFGVGEMTDGASCDIFRG